MCDFLTITSHLGEHALFVQQAEDADALGGPRLDEVHAQLVVLKVHVRPIDGLRRVHLLLQLEKVSVGRGGEGKRVRGGLDCREQKCTVGQLGLLFACPILRLNKIHWLAPQQNTTLTTSSWTPQCLQAGVVVSRRTM